MSNGTHFLDNSSSVFGSAGLGRVGAICKQILNIVAETHSRSAGRSRFAALPMRQLEDIGITIAQRDAMLR
jgi:uncharacterized protein YjiS (DUF1127 family)